jgi:protein-tyrosine sulfotransferase
VTERHFSGPAFILCAARSGSTLLRQVLDAHPQIACPPELNLAVAFDNILFSFRNSYVGDEREARAMAMRACRRLARETAGEYARLRGKQWWCDKSLSGIPVGAFYLPISQVYRYDRLGD